MEVKGKEASPSDNCYLDGAVERASRNSVDVRKIHTGPYEEDIHSEISKQPNGAEWHQASSNTGGSSTQSLHMQEKHMSYPRINKEAGGPSFCSIGG